jgi:putative protease
MELLAPDGNHRFRLEGLQDTAGAPLQEAPGGGWEVLARLPVEPPPLALLTRFLS